MSVADSVLIQLEGCKSVAGLIEGFRIQNLRSSATIWSPALACELSVASCTGSRCEEGCQSKFKAAYVLWKIVVFDFWPFHVFTSLY